MAALDAGGRLLAIERAAYPMRADPGTGAMEQDPATWLDALDRAVRALGARTPLGRVRAVGLTGQMPTMVALARGVPIGPAVTWMDGRADAFVDETLTPARRAAIYRATGMPVDGRYIGPMYAFHVAAQGRRADLVLSAKDYVYLHLTGEAWTDPSTAAGFAALRLDGSDWDRRLLARWQLVTAQLPRLAPADAAPAALRDSLADAWGVARGAAVHVGAADSVAAVLGAGGLADGCVTLVPGSSTVVMASVDAPRPDRRRRFLVTPHALPGRFGLEMDLLASGASIGWLAALCGTGEDELVGAAAAVPVGALGLRFAPYLAGGEQGALWDPALSGAVLGLRLGHRSAHLMRALLEGLAMEVRRCLDALTEADVPVRELLVAGGEPGAPPVLEGILADVAGLALTRVAIESAAAVGAALLTGATAVDPADAGAIRALHAQVTTRLAPTAERTDLYRSLYREHLAAFPRSARPARGAR